MSASDTSDSAHIYKFLVIDKKFRCQGSSSSKFNISDTPETNKV
jgi:hypothetical protein